MEKITHTSFIVRNCSGLVYFRNEHRDYQSGQPVAIGNYNIRQHQQSRLHAQCMQPLRIRANAQRRQ